MQVIRTYSIAARLLRMALGFAVFLVLMVLSALAFALPQPLVDHLLTQTRFVHNGTCTIPHVNAVSVRCLGFLDEKEGVVYFLLMDMKDGQLSETQLLARKTDGTDYTIVWCRHDVCV